MEDPWLLIFELTYIGAIPVTIFSILILRLTLDRNIRKSLPANREYDSPLDWYFGFMRTMAFAYAIASNWMNVRLQKNYYPEVDVNLIANRFERLISYCFIGGGVVLIACTLFFLVTKYFGILDWPEPVALHH